MKTITVGDYKILLDEAFIIKDIIPNDLPFLINTNFKETICHSFDVEKCLNDETKYARYFFDPIVIYSNHELLNLLVNSKLKDVHISGNFRPTILDLKLVSYSSQFEDEVFDEKFNIYINNLRILYDIVKDITTGFRKSVYTSKNLSILPNTYTNDFTAKLSNNEKFLIISNKYIFHNLSEEGTAKFKTVKDEKIITVDYLFLKKIKQFLEIRPCYKDQTGFFELHGEKYNCIQSDKPPDYYLTSSLYTPHTIPIVSTDLSVVFTRYYTIAKDRSLLEELYNNLTDFQFNTYDLISKFEENSIPDYIVKGKMKLKKEGIKKAKGKYNKFLVMYKKDTVTYSSPLSLLLKFLYLIRNLETIEIPTQLTTNDILYFKFNKLDLVKKDNTYKKYYIPSDRIDVITEDGKRIIFDWNLRVLAYYKK
jgi:hypothetical protein